MLRSGRTIPSPYPAKVDFFFGYGSLVNRATHAHDPAHPARITGWRRVWRHLPGRQFATLSVRPAPSETIDGLIAGVAAADWPALDQREALYERTEVTGAVDHDGPEAARIQIYQVTRPEAEDTRLPILLSYLDVVVQGYHQVFGCKGVDQFFATTDGWDGVILDDRTTPIYPRHQSLTPSERAMVDAAVTDLPAQVQEAHQTALAGKGFDLA